MWRGVAVYPLPLVYRLCNCMDACFGANETNPRAEISPPGLLHHLLHAGRRAPAGEVVKGLGRVRIDQPSVLYIERQMVVLHIPKGVNAVAGTTRAGRHVAAGTRKWHRLVNRRPDFPQFQPDVIKVHPDRLPGLLVDERHAAAIAVTGRLRRQPPQVEQGDRPDLPLDRIRTGEIQRLVKVGGLDVTGLGVTDENLLVSEKLGLEDWRLKIHRTLVILGVVTTDQRRASRGSSQT